MLESSVALGPSFLDPSTLLSSLGLAGVLGAVFAETGLLIGFFLPGDSLLFTAGLFSAQANPFAPFWLLLILVPIAAMIGDQVGYLIGRRTGPAVYRRPDGRLFKQRYVRQSHDFFERHGARTCCSRGSSPCCDALFTTTDGATVLTVVVRCSQLGNSFGHSLPKIGAPRQRGFLFGYAN